ncbi:MAG: class I SAM-dependent methyltransferase [Clostridia bacterium]|nr:class I SAM-dependent methyltransferase [Clostridia bacterium]
MLKKRLDMILSHIDGDAVADIGTDHGYIPVKLALSGKVKKIIATDLNKGPLDAARKNAEDNNVSFDLRLGSGLSPIEENECDTIVIAGMGGELISEILRADLDKAKKADRLLLQPMNSQDTLRKFLLENGFSITEEDLEVEGFKVYNLIIAQKGEGEIPYDEIFWHLPESLNCHPIFPKLIKKKLHEFDKILEGLLKAKDKDFDLIEKYQYLKKRAVEIDESI